MPADSLPPGQAQPGRASMFPSPPLLDPLTSLGGLWRRPTHAQRLLAFFDSGLFRLLGYVALLPLLLRALGEAQLGLVVVSGALFGYAGLALRGVRAETSRLVGAAWRVGDRGRVERVLTAAFVLLATSGFVLALPVAVFGRPIAAWFGADPVLLPVAALYLTLEAGRHALVAPASAFVAAADGIGLDLELRALRGLQALLELGVGFAVVGYELGLVGLAVLGALAAVTVAWLHRAALRRVAPDVGLRFDRLDRDALRRLTVGAGVLSAEAAAFLLMFEADVVILGAVLGLQAVTVFAIAAYGARLLTLLAVQLADTLYPAFSSLALHGDRLKTRWVFRRATDATLITASGLALLVAAFGKPLLGLWLDTRQVTTGTMMALGACVLASAPVTVGIRYLLRAGQQREVARVSVLAGVLHVILALALVADFGVTGVAVATALTLLGTVAWYLPALCCRHLGIAQLRFWWSRCWRLALVVVPAAVAAGLFVGFKQTRTARDLVVQVGIVVILHAVAGFAAWLLLESRPELDLD